ncbi:MAG: PAS domain-containing sensor histidine kinase [Candidatus Thermoplasmatota archaeon]|nr:PAS domain-containing sensor histidine kinase [Candidatus Thermoplasmatota archaeon]
MKNDCEDDIIRILREEERRGKLQSYSAVERKTIIAEGSGNDPLESIFTILRTHKQQDIPTIDIGDPIEKYRIIFDNSAVAIMLTNENERIVHWNTYTEKLLGMNREDLMMKPVKYLYPPEEWKKIRSENIRQKGIQYHLETKMLRKDNKCIDVSLSLSVLKDHIGNAIGSIGIIKDNSQNKQMEHSLRTSEEKFKQLYEKAPVPYHTLSPDGTITNVNEKWCQVLGYTKEEVTGTSIFNYIQHDEQEIAKSSFKEKIKSKNPYTGGHERTYKTKNGQTRVFVINDFLNFNESGDVTTINTTMEDVTERKKIEGELHKAHYWLEKEVQERTIEISKQNTLLKKRLNECKRSIGELHIELEKLQKTQKKTEQQNVKLKKLNRAKSDFFDITTHTLRGLLTTIKGYSEVLLMNSLGPINEDQRKGLDIIVSNATQMDRFMQDALDVTHLESGMMKFTLEKTNIKTLVLDVVERMQQEADKKQIAIQNEILEGITDISIDKNRMNQVITNLLYNAIVSSPEKSMIAIRAHSEADDLLFEIQDAGRRVPQEKQKKIFDMFYQGQTKEDQMISDLGLKLAIARGIVLSHGGKIWIDREDTTGNIFRFTLPYKSVQTIKSNSKDTNIIHKEKRKQ